MNDVYIIGIAGGTGSGKTTLTDKIKERFKDQISVVYHDSYYNCNDALTMEERNHLNYDHPDSLETDMLVEHLKQLRLGNPIECPVYDFSIHNRAKETVTVLPKKVIVVEGILLFHYPELRELFDLKIFVDVDADIRILRRLRRDLVERGRTVDSVINQYQETVKPMHELYVEPTKKLADIIVPSHGDTSAAIDVLIDRINAVLA